jgi:hypothetical protein
MKNPQEAFSHLLGLRAFGAKRGHGSFVTFSLAPTCEPNIKSCFVWVYMCCWKILDHGTALAHSESPDSDIDAAVSRINEMKLEGIVLHQYVIPDGLRHGASLMFEQGLVMKLFQYEKYTDVEPIFSTRNDSGIWTSFQSNGSIHINPDAEQIAVADRQQHHCLTPTTPQSPGG